MSNARVLAPNSLIAIIAVSGYIGSYCGLAALQAGYRVRGTVRSLERGKAVKDAYVKAGVKDIDTRLEIVILDDLSSVERYRKAFEGADGAVHAGIDWSEIGMVSIFDTLTRNALSVLEAAKLVPTLKRLVYVGTLASVVFQGSPTFLDKVLTAEDFNEENLKIVQEDITAGRTPHALRLYVAAKTKAEKAVWEFMDSEKVWYHAFIPRFCSAYWDVSIASF